MIIVGKYILVWYSIVLDAEVFTGTSVARPVDSGKLSSVCWDAEVSLRDFKAPRSSWALFSAEAVGDGRYSGVDWHGIRAASSVQTLRPYLGAGGSYL